jgi:hypothetical protein
MDNLHRFQKLVSTRWTFSISIGLDGRDPQPYIFGVFYTSLKIIRCTKKKIYLLMSGVLNLFCTATLFKYLQNLCDPKM